MVLQGESGCISAESGIIRALGSGAETELFYRLRARAKSVDAELGALCTCICPPRLRRGPLDHACMLPMHAPNVKCFGSHTMKPTRSKDIGDLEKLDDGERQEEPE